MTRFRTQLNRSVTILRPRKSLNYQHIFEYRPVSFYAVNYCTDALCIKDGVKIDPCCGSGGMFVQSARFVQAHSNNRGVVSVYGQESNADTWKMAKMNMAIRGIDADLGPYQADTFFNDLHPTLKAEISTQLLIQSGDSLCV